MAVAKPKLPSLYDYTDSRAYLRDWYAARKRADKRFSYAVFSRKAGLLSPSHLRNVAAGLVNLTPATADRFAKGLGLTEQQGEYLRLLVAHTQAPEGREREARLGELRYWLWQQGKRELRAEDAQALLTPPSRMLVFNLTCVRGFRADPAWISRKLAGRLTPREAREALRFLRAAGFIRAAGTRLLGTAASNTLLAEWDDAPNATDWARLVLSQAADPSRKRMPGFFSINTILTDGEARQVAGRLKRQALEALPPRRRRQVAGKLYLLVGDLFPLSG